MKFDLADSHYLRVQTAFQQAKGVTTDTRQCVPGMLFFALKGDRFDGNQFAETALASGCMAAVIDDPSWKHLEGAILVKNTLTALQTLAYWHRSRMECPVIGMTGSNGKTTTKELLRDILLTKYPQTHATRGNLNNHIGVPLTLLEMPLYTEIAIVEMGANAQGEIAELAAIAQPTHGVITNIGRAHLEGFGGEAGVLEGKRELFRFFESQRETTESPEIQVFVHAGHDRLMDISQSLLRKCYGTEEHRPWIRLSSSYSSKTTERMVYWDDPSGVKHGPIQPHISGAHNLENMATALAIGLHFGVPPPDCSQAIADYVPTNNRSQWEDTTENRVLLDAYNANPSSMESSMRYFNDTPVLIGGTNLCILGDMGELGDHTLQSHADILALATRLSMETIVVGPHFAAAYRLATAQLNNVHSFETVVELRRFLQNLQPQNRNIMLKGSRTMALETLIDSL